MHLIVKNMVCPRCIASVEGLLERHGLEARYVHLGDVELVTNPAAAVLEGLAADLRTAGFELLDDRKMQLIEEVKLLLIQKIQSGAVEDHFSLSHFIRQKIFRDYSSVSRLFSEVTGVTMEQFFILQKVEKIKEWLIYNEMSLGDMASRLGYSSTQHLSSQFKKVTGMTPSQFKDLGASQRKSIDQVIT